MQTARELADLVLRSRRAAWEKVDQTTAIVATEQLGPEDLAEVRRVVADSGYAGEELEQVVRQVSALVVGTVTALDDNLPATGGD
jgi:hypothetical protein